MKTLIVLVAICCIGLVSCGPKDHTEPLADEATLAPAVGHLYALKDGLEYGYEQGISEEAAKRGQLASELLMVRYAGERDGKHQAWFSAGASSAALECTNPCEFIKVINLFNGEPAGVERIRSVVGSIGWSVMTDAINGKLERYIESKKGQTVGYWVDDKIGLQTVPLGQP